MRTRRGQCWWRSICICWPSKEKFTVEKLFDRASLAVAENSDGDALFVTDFQADRPASCALVLDRGLGERAGAVVQRIIELETYRTLALLGLPEAQRLMPSIGRIEKRLGRSHRRNAPHRQTDRQPAPAR